MRKHRHHHRLLYVFAIVDILAIACGLFAAYLFRFHAGIIDITKGYSPRTYAEIFPVALLIWVLWLQEQGCYNFRERAFNLQILKKLMRANAFAIMTLITLHFFQRSLEFSRLIYVMAFFTCISFLALFRLVLDRVLASMRRTGRVKSTRVAILGTTSLALNVAQRIRNHAYLGLRVIGLINTGSRMEKNAEMNFPILGQFESIRDVIREHRIDEVIVAQPDLSPQQILDFILECEKEIVTIRVVPNLLEAVLVEMSVEQIDGIPLFGLKESPLQGWNIILKRLFDIATSVGVLVVFSPLMLLIAIGIKLTSRGPVLYKQERIGLDGKKFPMLKFRSMHVDAEATTGPVWARKGDDRVTGLGRLLRRLNLDELPQFWNVLRGDMSLVGPRPERPHFVNQFREMVPRYMGRHRVKSGMTGWAQVNGLRGNTSIDERIKYDLYYIENWSLWLDIKILMLTLQAHENAY